MSDKEVIKHSATIQMTNRVSLMARRLWNVFLANAYNNLLSQDTHDVELDDLKEAIGMPKSKNDDYIKELIVELTTTSVEWNVLGKDKDIEWGIAPLLAGGTIKKKKCSYGYSPFLKDKLYNPRLYTRIKLSMQRLFSSKHTLALYELFLDYLGCGETAFIGLEEFKKLLGLEKNEYAEFKELNKKIIKPALKEIDNKSNITVTVVTNKKNRVVISLKFHIQRKDVIAIEVSNEQNDMSDLPIYQRMIKDYGFSSAQAKEISGLYDVEYISEQLDLVDREYAKKKSKINNLAAYAYSSIMREYNYSKPKIEAEKDKEQEALEKSRRAKEEQDRLRIEYEDCRKKEVNKYRESVPKEEMVILEAEAKIKAQESMGNNRIGYKFFFNISLERILAEKIGFPPFEKWAGDKIHQSTSSK